MIITDGFWKSALGGDPSIVGRLVTLNQVAYTIVGVMPPGFEYLRPYDAFVSMAPIAGSRNVLSRGNHNGFAAVGRLKPGVTVEDARRELTAIAAQLESEYPATNTGIGVVTARLADRLVTTVRTTLLALFGAVGCLLLIACVNVASLLVARGAARQHELAVRAALGGGRLRLMRQLLVDSTMISAAGGLLGVLCAIWLLRLLVAAAPEGTPRISHVSIDGAALLFASAAAAICGLVFGAFPAFQAAGTQGQQALVRGRSTGFAARSHHVRRALIVVETALAIVLLVGAGLMIRTVQELIAVDTGFRADHVLTTRFTLSGTQWTEERRQAFYPEFLQRIRTIPGVTNAALTMSLPIDGSQWNSIFIVADKPAPAAVAAAERGVHAGVRRFLRDHGDSPPEGPPARRRRYADVADRRSSSTKRSRRPSGRARTRSASISSRAGRKTRVRGAKSSASSPTSSSMGWRATHRCRCICR